MAEGVMEEDGSNVVNLEEKRASSAEPEADPDKAPYGWTRDKTEPSGWRPKKRPGRGGRRKRLEPESEVDEEEYDPDRDPEPSWREHPFGGGVSEYKASASEKNEVASLLALLYSVPADFLIQADPYCFGALNANLQQVIDATVPVLCRSEKVVRFVTGQSGMMLWIQLAAALRPVAVAIFQHHITHSVELLVTEEGETVAVHQDYSAYSAA